MLCRKKYKSRSSRAVLFISFNNGYQRKTFYLVHVKNDTKCLSLEDKYFEGL